MKIDLEYPFKNTYKAGYLNINKEPRRLILLVRSDNSKTTISYARYLMSIHLGRFLDKKEHVDHIDNDKLNDVITNLQILSSKENNIKSLKNQNKQNIDIEITCPVCNKVCLKKKKNVFYKIKKGLTPTCSRVCGGIYSHKNI